MKKCLQTLALIFITVIILPFPLWASTHIKVGVYQNFPLTHFDENGNVKGFFIDILETIAENENWEIEYVRASWPECLEKLNTGQIDLMGPIAYSESRRELYDYTYESVITNWGQLYTGQKSNIESVVDLKDKKVAVLQNDIYFKGLKDLVDRLGIRCRFIEAFEYEDVLMLVELGRCEAGLVNHFYGHQFERNFKINKSPIIVSPEKLYYSVPKGKNKFLLDALDHHIRKLKANNLSIYYQSFQKWFGGEEQLSLTRWLKWAIIICVGLLCLFLPATLIFKAQVRSRTKELLSKNEELIHEVEHRRLAENARDEGEQKYSSLFQSSGEAIFLHDLEGNILDANQKAIEQLDYSKSELLKLKIFDLHPPSEHPKSQAAFNTIMANGQVNFEIEFRKKDGDVFLAEVTAVLFEIEAKKVIQGIVRDITERKKAESALYEHNAYMMALHDTSLGLIRRLNIDGLLTTIVDRAGKLVGAEDGYIFLHDEQNDDLVIKVGTGKFRNCAGLRIKANEGLSGKVWQSGKPLKVDNYQEWTGRHPDPRFDEIQMNIGIPLKSGDKTMGVIGLCSFDKNQQFGENEIAVLTRFADLTSIALDNAHLHAKLQQELHERKEAEKTLKNSRETFLTVLDSIDATIYAADMETYEIIFTNKCMRDTFGNNLVGKLCHQVFREDPEPCKHCTNKSLLDENGNPSGVVVWEGKNPITGKWYINYDRAIKWVDGRYVRLQVATDITKIKALEEERLKTEAYLRQAQKMEAIGTLAGGIAHDFNNILSAIMGYTELSMMELSGESKATYNLKEVFNASQRAKDVVKQILAFSRQADHERKPLDIGPIIKEAIKMLKASLPSTIKIQKWVDPDAGIIEADATQVHQIIMNLCTNAYHAMIEGGGTLGVKVENEDLEADAAKRMNIPPGNYLKITISDTGSGIPPDVLDRIFEPYFTTKEKDKGTGMGLAVVHGILKSYRGSITVDSKPGKGSTFTVYIPTDEKQIRTEHKIDYILPTGSEHVLFVDDEQALVDIGKQTLEYLGYAAETCTSSTAALERFQKSPDDFDLVITDLTMPDITGDKLAEEIKKIRRNIPVIICSGYRDVLTKKRADEIGISAFLTKPIVIQDLAIAVREALD